MTHLETIQCYDPDRYDGPVFFKLKDRFQIRRLFHALFRATKLKEETWERLISLPPGSYSNGEIIIRIYPRKTVGLCSVRGNIPHEYRLEVYRMYMRNRRASQKERLLIQVLDTVIAQKIDAREDLPRQRFIGFKEQDVYFIYDTEKSKVVQMNETPLLFYSLK